MGASALSLLIGGAVANKAIDSMKPEPPPPLPKEDDEEDEQARRKALIASKKRKGIGSGTILTSPLGVTGEANVTRKTLLGE